MVEVPGIPNKIDNQLRSIGDKFTHLENNLERYQQMMEPMRDHLQNQNVHDLSMNTTSMNLTDNKMYSTDR